MQQLRIIEILKICIVIFCIIALVLYWTKPTGTGKKLSKMTIENFFSFEK